MDTVLAGLINGNAYALVALGLSLVIGVTGIINFAQGSLFAVGAMVGWFVTTSLGLPLWLAAVAAMVVTALLGWVINRVAVKPFAGKAPIASVLATIAIMIILDATAELIFGPEIRPMASGLPTASFQLLGLRINAIDMVILCTSVVLMAGLASFLRWTRFGRAIRATSQDREAAAQMGVPINRVQSGAFMIASALGGLAGVLVAAYFTTISPTQGFTVGLAGLAAATLGGLGSLLGAVIGGLLLGVVEALGVATFGDSARQVITFGVLLGCLWLRPHGLLGSRSVKREPLTGTFFSAARKITIPPWAVAALVVAGALPIIPGLFSGYVVGVGVQIITFALAALSMTILGGQAGQLSLGQAGAVALGAYALAIMTKSAGVPFLVALLLAGIFGAVVMTVLATPSWRLSGHYPAIATLATGALIAAVAQVWDPVTGGGAGISLIPLPSVFGVQLDSNTMLYALGFVLLLTVCWLVRRWSNSHLGLYWRAIREDETAARSAGVPTPQYKSLAFGLSGFIAGIAGGFWAGQYGYINATIFNPLMSFQIVIIAVLGGMLSPFGAILGSIVMVGGLELFRFSSSGRLLVYGVVLLLLIHFRPQGLWTDTGTWSRLKQRFTRRSTAEAVSTHEHEGALA
ncbi:ABC transporter permease [Tessaracoccus antarcticus]|uniref:ABC transporter permease n=1 Tax=Tessaracoccus antarcticus TaxID=2479848 RepID=A0A3M0G9C5_9ACTN|nr:ABC transporter permease [Tessaracoccus antarcticus]RMB61601.1 ABC transporter permease [Tessaracoccus antarcticus]